MAAVGSKPFTVGSTVEVDGRTFTVWSPGPAPASVWAAEDGDTARMYALKLPTPRRAAYVLQDGDDAAERVRTRERLRATGTLVMVRTVTPAREYSSGPPSPETVEDALSGPHLPTCPTARGGVGHVLSRPHEMATATVVAVLATGTPDAPLSWARDVLPTCCARSER